MASPQDPSSPYRSRWRRAALLLALVVAAGVVLAGFTMRPAKPLVISSGEPGDTYFRVGAALQDVLEDAFPGFPEGHDLDFVNQASHGATENVQRILAGQAQLGLAQEGIELNFRRGSDTHVEPAGNGAADAPQVRALALLFKSPLKIVARRDLAPAGKPARLQSVGDLRNLIEVRRSSRLPALNVYLGAEGTGTRVAAGNVLEHYGLAPRPSGDAGKPVDLVVVGGDWTFAEAKRHLMSGDVDVAFFLTAIGAAAMRDLDGNGRFTLLAVDRAHGVQRSHPYMDVVTIPASSFPAASAFPDRDVQTLSLDEILIASSTLPDKVAYRIVEELFNRSHLLVSLLPFMTPLTKADQLAQRYYYPPHPGAIAYYHGRPEPQGLVDFVQRYRDFLVALFSLGGTAWAGFHFLAGRWRTGPLIQRLRRNPSEAQIHEVEREATHLFATGKIKRETYESVKEYVRVRLNEVRGKP